jgi:hypothetical protein
MKGRAAVTLSNENRPSRSRPCHEPGRAASGAQQAAHASRWPIRPLPAVPRQE